MGTKPMTIPDAKSETKTAGKYRRPLRIAIVGVALIVIAYCAALVAFPVLGARVFPTDDFSMLITLPPRKIVRGQE